MQNQDWNIFHDWMIGPIEVDWKKGAVRIHLLFESDHVIEISSMRNISIPRYLPWGMSQYVNSIKCEEKCDMCQLKIDLQSGDSLIFEGGKVSIT